MITVIVPHDVIILFHPLSSAQAFKSAAGEGDAGAFNQHRAADSYPRPESKAADAAMRCSLLAVCDVHPDLSAPLLPGHN